MSDARTAPDDVLAARGSLLTYLRDLAPQEWAWLIRNGTQFHVPARWAALLVDAQARHLAETEAQRLAEATCWHLDAGCVEAAMRWAARSLQGDYSLTAADLPSPAGFLVWADRISPDNYPGQVVAVHWRVESDGVWMAWWTDKEASLPAIAAANQVTVNEMRQALAGHGVCLYDRERLLPLATGPTPQAPPDKEHDPAVIGMTAVTLGTWRLLSENRVVLRQVDELVHAASLPAGATSESVWS